jgi:hypothetical protein
VGQELSEAEKNELQEYGISCGYQPGAMLLVELMKKPWDVFTIMSGRK